MNMKKRLYRPGMPGPTIRLKIFHYKKILALGEKDKRMKMLKEKNEKKRQSLKIEDLKKSIIRLGPALKEALNGNMQELARKFVHRKTLFLTFQNSHPSKLIDHLVNENFIKRKNLDRLVYLRESKMNKICLLKKEKKLLEMSMDWDGSVLNEKIEKVMRQIHDINLKSNAAMGISYVYRDILEILKKDARYFDHVLISVAKEIHSQGAVLCSALRLDVNAIKHSQTRKNLYMAFTQMVKSHMRRMKQLLVHFNTEASIMARRLEFILKSNNYGPQYLTMSFLTTTDNREIQFQHDIRLFEKTLVFLRGRMMTSNFDSILPSLMERHNQNIRLKTLVKKYERARKILLEKKSKAEEMCFMIIKTRTDETDRYNEEKQLFLDAIEKSKINQGVAMEQVNFSLNLLAEIEAQVRQLNQKFRQQFTCHDTMVQFQTNAIQHMTHLKENIEKLIDEWKNKELIERDDEQRGKKIYFKTISNLHEQSYMMALKAMPPIRADKTLPISCKVPTRNDIKYRSEKIIAKSKRHEVIRR